MSNNDLRCSACGGQHHPAECLKEEVMSKEKDWLVECIENYDYIERCSDCDGVGHLGRHQNGKLISCESCGGHEDSLGKGFLLNDISELAHAIRQELVRRIEELPKPYPKDIFPEIPSGEWKKIDRVLRDNGYSLTRMSGNIMRLARENALDEVIKEISNES